MGKCNLSSKSKWDILYVLRHHAKNLEPMYLELINILYFTSKNFTHDSWSTGPNSQFIITPDGKHHYLRGVPASGEIQVRRTIRSQKMSAVWRTRMDVRDWALNVGLI